jgi:hypothetical protein
MFLKDIKIQLHKRKIKIHFYKKTEIKNI